MTARLQFCWTALRLSEMKKRTIVAFALAISVICASSCANEPSSTDGDPVVKENTEPVADREIAVIEMEKSDVYGTIKLELYSNLAPQMVARFKELAREGFYDGTTFHRINPTIIQGGDPNSKDNDPENDGKGNSEKPDIVAEFSDVEFDRGIVGAARLGSDVNSQNAQFFITLRREAQFDKNYTVFGKVIDGLSNAKTISGAPRDGERPIGDIVIKTIRIENKEESD